MKKVKMFCCPAALHRVMLFACYHVENFGLVEDYIDFCDKAENCKTHSFLCEENPSETNYDYEMMDQEHATKSDVDDHIYDLCHVNTQGECNQMLGREGGGEH